MIKMSAMVDFTESGEVDLETFDFFGEVKDLDNDVETRDKAEQPEDKNDVGDLRKNTLKYPDGMYVNMLSMPSKDALYDKKINEYADEYWRCDDAPPFSDNIVKKIWNDFLLEDKIDVRKLLCLDLCGYLSGYLWPNYIWKETPDQPRSSNEHVISIILLMNERFRLENKDHWAALTEDRVKFAGFITTVLHIAIQPYSINCSETHLNLFYRKGVLSFLINLFHSLENPAVRSEAIRLTRIGIWTHLSSESRAAVLEKYEYFKKEWDEFVTRSGSSTDGGGSVKAGQGKKKRGTAAKRLQSENSIAKIPSISDMKELRIFLEKSFFFEYTGVFLEILKSISDDGKDYIRAISYCERYLEFLTDLLHQLITRRYLNYMLKYLHFYACLRVSSLHTRKCHIYRNNTDTNSGSTLSVEDGDPDALFLVLSEDLVDCAYSYVDDFTAEPVYGLTIEKRFYSNILQLQRVAFTKFPEKLRDFITSSSYSLSTPEALKKHFCNLTDKELSVICSSIGLLSKYDPVYSRYPTLYKKRFKIDTESMIESIVLNCLTRDPRGNFIKKLTTLPDEDSLYGESSLSCARNFSNTHSLPVPKLNLQFLSIEDYLLRNLKLYFFESSFTIAQDINAIIYHLNPRSVMDRNSGKEFTFFNGSSPFALPIDPPKITKVDAVRLWQSYPSSVEIEIDLNLERIPPSFREAWRNIHANEVLFLLSIELNGSSYKQKDTNPAKGGSKSLKKAKYWCHPSFGYVRGCRFISYISDPQLTDTAGDSGRGESFAPRDSRYPENLKENIIKMKVELDTLRYQKDMLNKDAPSEDDMQNVSEVAENNIYTRMNMMIRRKPQENNFESVFPLLLERLENPQYTGPEWLYDIFLGYGDARRVSYKNINNNYLIVDYDNTFQDVDHVKENFPGHSIDMNPVHTAAPTNHFSSEAGNPPQKVTKGRRTRAKAKKSLKLTPAKPLICVPPYVISIPLLYFPNHSEIDTPTPHLRITPGAKIALAQRTECNGYISNNIGHFLKNGFNTEELDHLNLKVDMNSVIVSSYTKDSVTPLSALLKFNTHRPTESTRYTSKQVESIISGISKSLTLVLGPPGTGKTDVASRIIAILHKNYPEERILLVTHSNHALNQLFEKIFNTDIDPRHLLRLGHGEEELNVEYNYRNSELDASEARSAWGKYGRVNAFLEMRINLLEKVSNIAYSLGMPETHGSSCRTAGYFMANCITPRWEVFVDKLCSLTSEKDRNVDMVLELFPFSKYFLSLAAKLLVDNNAEDMREALFPSKLSFVEAVIAARIYYEHIQYVFSQINQISAFELIASNHERLNHLLAHETRIVAMTCTQAALKYADFSKLNFRYDSLVMEEASQVLESETFAPLLMQNLDYKTGSCRLKRVIMIGDHNQLPPVVRNKAFQRYANMEQSLFLRFIRLGVPAIQLDAQGRCRPSICDLFRWKYPNLKDLSCIKNDLIMKKANPGFAFEFQVVDVPLHNGRGEFQPRLHFIQNYQEAEYIASVYTYMILLDYPSEKISILAMYNGQQELIISTLEYHRSKYSKMYNFELPMPRHVITVDKFQGQQNDYIILSLTRTRFIGHLRDIRRLIVAVSRARLGLYIFGFTSLLSKYLEIKELWSKLCERPTDGLWIFSGEKYSDITNNLGSFRDVDCEIITTSEHKSPKHTVKKKFKDNVFKISNYEHMAAYVEQIFRERNEYIESQNPQSSS